MFLASAKKYEALKSKVGSRCKCCFEQLPKFSKTLPTYPESFSLGFLRAKHFGALCLVLGRIEISVS